jgi:hypothetical protein
MARIRNWPSLKKIKLPLWLRIVIYALPVFLTVMFYLLRSNSRVMGWFVLNISAPVRNFLAWVSSVYPLSIMEILIAGAIIWVIYFIIKSFSLSSRRSGKFKIFGKRMLTLATVILYVWSVFIWLWNSGYFAPGFAERNGFSGQGVTVEELTVVTWHFAERANEFSVQVNRDDDGRVVADRNEILDLSTETFRNITSEFPCLEGRLFRPKPLLFSWLMSRTGYSGVYFALTGEANINNQLPIFIMPTVATHELAHHLGVFAEDEANFVAILAATTSEFTIFEYSGYLFGLMYLMRPLQTANPDAWSEINDALSPQVLRDWREYFEFWQAQRTFDTGIGFVDTALTTITEATREAVNTMYDNFLRANRQELGLQSYGAVVDLLVEYFARWQ